MRKLFGMFVACSFLLASSAYAADLNIAMVDLQVAMNKSEVGIKANAELKTELEKAQARGQKLAKDFKQLSDEYEAQKNILPPDAAQRKVAEIQKKKVELERFEKDTSEELQRKQMQYVNVIVEEMAKIISTYAEEKKYDLVLEAKASGTLFWNPKFDITDEIVKRYNEWKKAKK